MQTSVLLIVIAISILIIICLFLMRRIWLKWKDDPGLRVKVNTDEKGKSIWLFFSDYAFPVGLLYLSLCLIILVYNLSFLLRGVFMQSEEFSILDFIKFLNQQGDYFYMMAATSLLFAFLIIPERSKYLDEYRYTFVVMAIVWVLIPLTVSWFLSGIKF